MIKVIFIVDTSPFARQVAELTLSSAEPNERIQWKNGLALQHDRGTRFLEI